MKDLTNFAVVVLAILLANFLHSLGLYFMSAYLGGSSVYKKVAISMVGTIVLFYIVFKLLEKFIRAGSSKYVKGSTKLTGNSFVGLLIGFSAAVLLLFIGFSYTWYQKNALLDFKNWVKGLL